MPKRRRTTTTTAPAPSPVETSPATGLVRFLDTDFGNSAIPDVSWFQARKAEGYEGFMTTAHTYWGGVPQPWIGTQTALDRASAAGMWIAAYGRPVENWKEALDNCGVYAFPLRFFLLDVEDEPKGLHPVTRAMVDGVKAAGVRPVIYTAKSMWQRVMGSSAAFADVPLFDYVTGVYGWPTALESPDYGGWQKRVGQQLRLSVDRGGIVCDDDVIERSFIEGGV